MIFVVFVFMRGPHGGRGGGAQVAKLLFSGSGVPLASLRACDCDMRSEGAVALAEALPLNTRLRHLHLDLNPRCDAAAWGLLLRALAHKQRACPGVSGLEALSLVDCALPAIAVLPLARLVAPPRRDGGQPTLRVLDLSHNELGPAGVHALATAVADVAVEKRARSSTSGNDGGDLSVCALSALGLACVGVGFPTSPRPPTPHAPAASETESAVLTLCDALPAMPALSDLRLGGNGLAPADAERLLRRVDELAAGSGGAAAAAARAGAPLYVDLTMPGEVFAPLTRVDAAAAAKKGKKSGKKKGGKK